jgi:hypothetical protein
MFIFTLGLAVLLGGTLIALAYAALRTYWIFRQPVEKSYPQADSRLCG